MESEPSSQCCRRAANTALAVFMRLLREKAAGGMVPLAEAEHVFAVLSSSEHTLLDEVFEAAERGCVVAHQQDLVERLRTDAFGRILVHTFTDLLHDHSLSRAMLPNFFSAVRMIVGDDAMTRYQQDCAGIVEAMRTVGPFSWDDYYHDPRAISVRDHALTRVAQAFKRFEPRKDWLIKVLMHDPESVSVGPNAFVSLHREGFTFGDGEFVRLMTALFADLRPAKLDAERAARLEAEFGEPVGKLFGPLFTGLAEMA